MKNSHFYEFSAENISGKTIGMKAYEGKVVLIVNTASKCGLTPQFEGLEELYKKYMDQGFVVLGFPCNQFNEQEPGGSEEIQEFCQRNYGVSFPMFQKIEVNGPNTHPLFEFLKSKLGSLFGRKIKWNFTKFLVSAEGKPLKRFAPTTKPEKIEPFIQKALQQKNS